MRAPSSRLRRPASRRARAAALAGVAAGMLAACAGDAKDGPREPRHVATPAPRAELLLEAGDSTYWVTSGPGGVRLRGSPVLLARADGRFYELFVTDDDQSYFDAVFVGQRLWKRDLLAGDSTVLVEDSLVLAALAGWERRHPDEEPLEPDEPESEDPSTVATGDFEVLDVHGPYVSYERHTDVDVAGEPHRHLLRRGVIDLRDGSPTSLATLVGAEGAAAAVREARRRYEAALDSVRRARDERGRRAARALAGFPFDATSFALVAAEGVPAVAFLVPGRGDDAGGLGLPLAPVRVAPPRWWHEVAPLLPRAVADSVDQWPLGGALVLDATWEADGERLQLVLRDSAGGRWPVGRVQAPPRWLLRLDHPPLDAATRRALARAFDESALYSDEARTVAYHPGRAGRAPVVRATVLRPGAPGARLSPEPSARRRPAGRAGARHHASP